MVSGSPEYPIRGVGSVAERDDRCDSRDMGHDASSEPPLTPREVAERLGVTVRTVQRWIADGRLPATRVGARVRVAPADLRRVADDVSLPGAPGPSARPRPIRCVLIANRGEIAARIARTARRLGIRSVAIHAPDETPYGDFDAGREVPSYLDGAAIIGAASASGADAVHPGYGFLAENASFAAAVTRAGLAWVGPPPAAIAAMGDKAAARRLAVDRGVPVLPGYEGAEQGDARLAAEAQRIGWPVLVKPAAGGGGKGMRVVTRPEELHEALAGARREAAAAFGDDRLILERYLPAPRHVEVQLLFDRHGCGIHLGARDCSVQRRHQKVVEETPAPAVDGPLLDAMGRAALEVAKSVGYEGAGTAEFLLAEDGGFFFLEMNTRLQVEHPVTELVTGRDLVADQLRIAAGDPLGLEQADVRFAGHAIEARLYAEDPDAGFLPATGRIAALRWPSGDGIRVDAGVSQGDEVTTRYDPLLAKLVAHGADRPQALHRLRTALAATLVLGVRTNLGFLRWLLEQPFFERAEARTDTLASAWQPRPIAIPEEAWQAAAALLEVEGTAAWRGGWRLNAPPVIRLRSGEQARRVERPAAGALAAHEVAIVDGSAFVDVDGRSVEFTVAAAPSVEEAARHAAQVGSGAAVLTAPMPGRVISIGPVVGATVGAHQAVVVLEAMKMENAVVAPFDGTLRAVHVQIGQQVQRGDPLAEVAP